MGLHLIHKLYAGTDVAVWFTDKYRYRHETLTYIYN